MEKNYWFLQDPTLKAAYEEADAEEKAYMEMTDDIIRQKPKEWRLKFAKSPTIEAVKMLREEVEKAAKVEKFLNENNEINNLLKNLTPEEKIEFHKAAAIEQRRLLYKEPWLLRKFDYKTRMEILAEYTPEQQANMKARIDLEDDFRREKRKGFG
mgnify:CR=1 FL=1|tara:strand:+ start:784 stop:1248 length:465 start_codon:yes stop_codon:yes gene_type:complete